MTDEEQVFDFFFGYITYCTHSYCIINTSQNVDKFVSGDTLNTVAKRMKRPKG